MTAVPDAARPARERPRPSSTGAAAPTRRRRPRRRPAAPAAPVQAVVPQAASRPAAAAPGDAPTFAALGVPAALVDALTAAGIATAFPVQAATLPDSLAGRDVLGRGRTGSGKTLAFAVPLAARLAGGRRSRPRRPRGLVLLPTRELASQVAATLEPLAAASGLRVAVVFGGVPQKRQVAALDAGVDVLVACPGRLDDLVKQGLCHLDAVELTVLDEADHMADLGFLPVVRRLLDRTPADGQRLLFSATLDNDVEVLVRRYLHDPAQHAVEETTAGPAQGDMSHHVLHVRDDDKAAVVRTLALGASRAVFFTRTKHRAKRLAAQLSAAGIPAVDLHGNLSQNARERNLAAFHQGRARVLVATDIAARGIHVDEVSLVVHVDPPAEHKAYLHRSGRTARAGSTGAVATIVTPEQRAEVAQLQRKAGISALVRSVDARDQLLELAG
ncbi:MAG: DEAD/DEAH box helicase [Motilibacteraceae bacterium]